jgi:hypothetical protein
MYGWIDTQDSAGRMPGETHAAAVNSSDSGAHGSTQDTAPVSDGAQYVVHVLVCAECRGLLRELRLSVHERSVAPAYRVRQ